MFHDGQPDLFGKIFHPRNAVAVRKKREVAENREKFIGHLVRQFEFKNNDFKILNSGLHDILIGSEVSLRTIEKVIANLALLLASSYRVVSERPHLAAILLAIRTIDSDSFYKARHGTLSESELVAFAKKMGENHLPIGYLKVCVSDVELTESEAEQVQQFFGGMRPINPKNDFQELIAIIEEL